jgi:uncharacterized protein with PQ loop repeat
MMHVISLIASVALPLFNLPLIIRVIRRKSSGDISLTWAWGVWICFLLMAPDGLTTTDTVWKTFIIANLILFTAVVVTVTIYRKRGQNG